MFSFRSYCSNVPQENGDDNGSTCLALTTCTRQPPFFLKRSTHSHTHTYTYTGKAFIEKSNNGRLFHVSIRLIVFIPTVRWFFPIAGVCFPYSFCVRYTISFKEDSTCFFFVSSFHSSVCSLFCEVKTLPRWRRKTANFDICSRGKTRRRRGDAHRQTTRY